MKLPQIKLSLDIKYTFLYNSRMNMSKFSELLIYESITVVSVSFLVKVVGSFKGGLRKINYRYRRGVPFDIKLKFIVYIVYIKKLKIYLS